MTHFIQSSEAALAELPPLLAGRDPKSPHDNGVGTHDYSKRPRAVIFGRAFALKDIEELYKVFGNRSAEPVAWIAGDPAKQPGPGTPPPGPAYAQVAANAVKAALSPWKEEGGVKDGIIVY